jgi:NAD(P)-dependent dehydrogenase (short-subunit alcohol dehydrogenase family)
VPSGSVLITGANRGIGWATAVALASAGLDLVLACRHLSSAEEARSRLGAGATHGRIEARELDLASLASIRRFAAGCEADGLRIGTLINNAGVLAEDFALSEDGFELSMAVNYLGPFLLTRLLLPAFSKAGGLVINTCSSAFRIGRLPHSFGEELRMGWHPIRAYADSKLALLMFSIELSRRLSRLPIKVLAVDPGIVSTGMISLHKWFDPLTDALFRPLIQTEAQGARGSIAMTLSTDGEFSSGGYYRGRRSIVVPRRARKADKLEGLWSITESALGVEGWLDGHP